MNNLLSIGQAAELLNVSVMTLRRWEESGRLAAIRSKGGHRYYEPETIFRLKHDIGTIAKLWAAPNEAPTIPEEYYSDTQDKFIGRLGAMAQSIAAIPNQVALAPLLPAVAGEIGNNSFDHNLGNWPDARGIFFGYDTTKRQILLADRGLGIRTTLSRVKPGLMDDVDALEIAMNEVISGRFPENRGNGLKFVRNVALENRIGLTLQSGNAIATIELGNPKSLQIKRTGQNVRGVITRIEY